MTTDKLDLIDESIRRGVTPKQFSEIAKRANGDRDAILTVLLGFPVVTVTDAEVRRRRVFLARSGQLRDPHPDQRSRLCGVGWR